MSTRHNHGAWIHRRRCTALFNLKRLLSQKKDVIPERRERMEAEIEVLKKRGAEA